MQPALRARVRQQEGDYKESIITRQNSAKHMLEDFDPSNPGRLVLRSLGTPEASLLSQTRYGPVGRCIYCPNEKNLRLTDEHIIARSLDASLILLKASCDSCSTVTSRIELFVAREMWGDMRMRHNLPTRKPKDRPATLSVKAVYRDRDEQIRVPREDYKAPFPVLWYPQAGILIGRDPTDKVQIYGEVWEWPSETTAKTLQATLAYSGKVDHIIFARMLAKIAHGYAVAQMGLDGFIPMLPDYILEQRPDVLHVVGGDPRFHTPSVHSSTTTIHFLQLGVSEWPAGEFLTCEIRLFSTLAGLEGKGMPIYQVVIGRANNLTRSRLENAPYYQPL